MIAGAVLIMAAGLGLMWLASRMWRERLRRNPIAGLRTKATMRSDEAFRVANKAAAPLTAVAGVIFIASGVAAALMPMATAGYTLLAGVLAAAGVCIAAGVKGVRACR